MKLFIVICAILASSSENLAKADPSFLYPTTEEMVTLPRLVSILSQSSNKTLLLEKSVNATVQDHQNFESRIETPEATHSGIFRGFVLHLKNSVYTSELPLQDIIAVERNGWFVERSSSGKLLVGFSQPSRFSDVKVSQSVSWGAGSDERCRFGERANPRNLDRVGEGSLDYELKRALILNRFVCVERF